MIESYPARDYDAPADGPFAGVPFLLKDLVCHEAGQRYGLGSRLARGVTVPHDTDGMPLGAQFVAPHGGEAALLALAAVLEQARPWAQRHPVTKT